MPRLQIITVADLLDERLPKMPPLPQPSRRPVRARRRRKTDQLDLLLPFENKGIKPAKGDFIDPRFDPRFGTASR
jgi:hypothetical protein